VFVYVLRLLQEFLINLINMRIIFHCKLLHFAVLPSFVYAKDQIKLLLQIWLNILRPLWLIDQVIVGVSWVQSLIYIKLMNGLVWYICCLLFNVAAIKMVSRINIWCDTLIQAFWWRSSCTLAFYWLILSNISFLFVWEVNIFNKSTIHFGKLNKHILFINQYFVQIKIRHYLWTHYLSAIIFEIYGGFLRI